ncbi:MAG TPA: class I SAM-dependent methyltransferase [Thermoanaerobaculia bacterium]
MINDALRRARTTALWLASPAESAWRRLRGKRSLPPLWLRRHTGPVSAFERSARELGAFLDELALLRDADRVLDIGCGAGAIVPELAPRLGSAGRYVGFDVHAPSIRWCRRRYGSDPRFSFVRAEIASVYGSRSGPPVASYRFPLDDGAADLILAKSVFTHLLAADAAHYLSEIHRTLQPGRAAVVTAFLFDASAPELAAVSRAFPGADGEGLVRWRSRRRPEAAVAYEKSVFFRMVETAGLRVVWMSAGFFPGAAVPKGQDTLLLGY